MNVLWTCLKDTSGKLRFCDEHNKHSISVYAKGEWHFFLPATACVGSMAAIVIICAEIKMETEYKINQGITKRMNKVIVPEEQNCWVNRMAICQ